MVENIIGHWKLNETSGNVANDNTTNGNHATVTGTSIEQGLFGNARVIYGESQDRIEVGDVSIFKFEEHDFTISAWFKKGNLPTSAQAILSKWDASTNNKAWLVSIQTDGTLDFEVSANGTTTYKTLSTPLAVTDGDWHLVTVSRSGTQATLYIDGSIAEQTVLFGPSAVFSSTASLAFGNYTNAAAWDGSLDGYIDNVRIYNYEMSPEEVNDLFYDTGFDRFPPWFEAIDPYEDETGVLVDTPIIFRYLDVNTDLDTLNVTLNDFPVVTAGVPEDGYTALAEYFDDGYSDGYDGYEITLYHDFPLPERMEITVELDAADAYGSFTVYQYTFFTASSYDPPPTYDNLNPLNGTLGLDPADSLYYQFNDGYETGPDLVSGADLSTLQMVVNSESVIIGGVIQSGYSGSIVANGYGGYNVTVTKDIGWPLGKTLEISMDGNDLNGSARSHSYVVKVGGGPIITDVTPVDLSVAVVRDTAITCTIYDAVFGIDKTGVDVTINGSAAITAGSPAAPSYVALFTDIVDGYDLVIGHPTLSEYSDIPVTISVTNRVGETAIYNFSYYTQDQSQPVVIPVVPVSEAQRVNLETNIEFRVIDGYSGVDAYSLDVSVNGYDAVIDGWAQPGYLVEYIPITDGYLVVLDPLTALNEVSSYIIDVAVYDFEFNNAEASYKFVTDDVSAPVFANLDPGDLEKALPISDIEFEVHDSGGSGVIPDLLNATVDGNPAIVNGAFQVGFTGSISSTTVGGFDGYHVLINSDLPFVLGTFVNVSLEAKDAYGLSSIINYSIDMDDEGIPVISYLDPEADGYSPLRPYIRFKIHDSGGTGVDPARIHMTVDDLPAIVGGDIAPRFSGAIEKTSVDFYDGYNVWVRLDSRFDPSTIHYVVIDGYDVYDNLVHLEYQFTTTSDDTVPTFDEFDPEPGETDVNSSTNIFFEFNDSDLPFVSNINTLGVQIDGTIAIINGQSVGDYTADISPNLNDGYNVTVYLPSDLPEYQWIQVVLDGYDEADNFASFEYSFRTEDVHAPTIENVLPIPGTIGVHSGALIEFDIMDGYSGVNLDTLGITVDGKSAVVDGIPQGQDGYDLDVFFITDGYSVSLIGSDFTEWNTSLVSVSVEDNEGNLALFEYSFTIADLVGPDFDAIYPPTFAIDVNNHTDISFQYIDPMSGPNLGGLTVLINQVPIVLGGIAQPGFTMGATPIENGFLIEIDEIVMTEGQEIEVELDGYDNSGNRTILTYALTGAYTVPLFSNFDPGDEAVSQALDTSVTFNVTDAYGVDLSTLDVTLNDGPAVVDGQPQDGYDVTYVEITDGYTVYVYHNVPFNEADFIRVDLGINDFNGVTGTVSYSFRTTSSLYPEFIDITPGPLSTNQNEDDPISFKIFDPALVGIYPQSIYIWVNNALAMEAGVPVDGYSIELFSASDGYEVVIEHERFDPYSRIYVGARATNIDGNTAEIEYYFDVSERAFPDVINMSPDNLEIDVQRTADVCFDVVDFTGVDYFSMRVMIDGTIAFENGEFSPGFRDPNSEVNALEEKDFLHFEDIQDAFVPNPIFYSGTPTYDLYFLEGDGYYYSPDAYGDYDQDGDGYGDGYILYDPGLWVENDGYSDGYDGYDGYVADGYFDDGYDGYIATKTVGYRFCIDSEADFDFGQIVTIEVYACDILGNCGTRSYYFTVISETGPPVFELLDPYPDEEDVPLEKIISFTFRDESGSGTNLSTLDVIIAGKNAIIDGEFQDGYSGSTLFIGDGYEVEITPDIPLPNYEVISMYLYGEDYVGNSTAVAYHFRTLDSDVPVFLHIFPAPTAVDVPTDTVVRFDFNDVTDSGANLSTLDVFMNGTWIMLGGVPQDGYDAEIWHNDQDGYSVQMYMPDRLPEWRRISMVLQGYDNVGNFGHISYNWKTADETPPEFVNITPYYPGSKINGTGLISIDIVEPSSGLDLDSIGFTVGGTSIIDSGITQPVGYVTNLSPTSDGYRLTAQSIGPLPHVLDSDTAALWRMNDVIPTLVENETGDASLNGTAISTAITTGKFGSARGFSSASSRIAVAADPQLALQDMTIEAWVKPSSLTGEHVVYTYNPQQTLTFARGLVLKITSSGALVIDIGDGTSVYNRISTSAGLITAGSYFHVAAIVSKVNNSVILMVNGRVQATAAFPVSNIQYSDGPIGSPPSATVLVGNMVNPFTGLYFDAFVGDIDDIRISTLRSVSDVANSYNRSLLVSFSEFELVPVEIFTRDLSGNDGYLDYSFFTLDETAPEFGNYMPSAGDVRVDLNTDIEFDFTDAHSGPDMDSLDVTVDGELVVADGVGLNGHLISISPITDGYRVSVDLDHPLPEFKNIVVTLDGWDIDPNQTVVEYQFSTDDVSEPELVNEIPVDGSVEVTPFTDVMFDIHDFNGSGLDSSTLNVQIDNRNAVISGTPQSGWEVDVDGYVWIDGYEGVSYIIRSSRFALNSVIRVAVDGYDAYGNYFDIDYAFRTFNDVLPPEFVNLSPAADEIEVALNKDIEFDIVDGYDVDIDRLNVHVDNIPAILDGWYQPGFNGPSNAINEIVDGYSVVIDPDDNFVYNQQVTVVIDGYDLTGNAVSFEYYFYTIADTDGPIVSDKNPDADEVEIVINSDVEFNITDAISGVDMTKLNVHIDSIPAILEGVIQYGWDGSSAGIETVVDGYHIVLDPVDGYVFTFNQVHAVTVDGYDNADNHTHELYSFATIADPNEPLLSNFDPLPSSDEAPAATDIVFDITDPVAGVDMTRLDVYVNGVPAITNGVIKAPFADINSGLVPITDGYTVTLDMFSDFGYFEFEDVIIDGYDYADNHVHYEYFFITKVDVTGPDIIPIDPVDSVGDYSRDTDIILQVLDYETGVDLDMIDITIDGSLVMQDGLFIPGSGFDGAYGEIVQLPDGYEIIFDSVTTFPPMYDVRVIVDGYDFGGSQRHLEYVFTTTDDVGPYIYDFHPIPNTVDAENDPLHISFGLADYGGGEVDLSTLTIELSEDIGEPFIIVYEPVEEFQNGWTGVLDGHPSGDGYVINMYKVEQGASFAVYGIKVTSSDDFGNWSVSTVGKPQEYVDTTTGTIVSPDRMTVGEFFIDSNEIMPGDMAVVDDVGEFEIDGYDGDDIIFSTGISAGGTQTINVYRGAFMVERRIFEPLVATSTSSLTVDLTFSDPYKITGTVLNSTAYVISGGDYALWVTGVTQVDYDTVELDINNHMQPGVSYVITVDGVDIYNLRGFSIDDGYEDVDVVGYPDVRQPRVDSAIVEPYNINVTVVFDDYMQQNYELLQVSNYILSHGAYVTAVTVDPKKKDRVVLTVENLYNREWFDVFVRGRMKDIFGNLLDSTYNHAVVRPEPTPAALSGIAGRLKTRNKVRHLHEDENMWYVGTTGGIDIVSKIELENRGFVLDGYGFNAITTDDNYVYFGCNDGYSEDAYGVWKLAFSDLGGNNTPDIAGAFGTPELSSNEVNDLSRSTDAGRNIIAIATSAGATVVVDGYATRYSIGYDISAAQLDDGGNTLYLGNNTLGRIEVFYDVNTNTVDNPVPHTFYSTTTSPELSSGIINQIEILNNTSIMDSWSNTLYIATDNGLTRIDTDESSPGLSEGGGISFVYGIPGSSGTTYDVLGGRVNRVVAVDVNPQQSQLFILTDDASHGGGMTIVNIPSNTQFSFSSAANGKLISRELSDLTFKNL